MLDQWNSHCKTVRIGGYRADGSFGGFGSFRAFQFPRSAAPSPSRISSTKGMKSGMSKSRMNKTAVTPNRTGKRRRTRYAISGAAYHKAKILPPPLPAEDDQREGTLLVTEEHEGVGLDLNSILANINLILGRA